MICRVCDGTSLVPVVDLGSQPWCNHFLKAEEIGLEPYYPLRVVFCTDCNTAQLDYTVPKETMFGDHTYLSGITSSLSRHFQEVAELVDKRFFEHAARKAVLDIGSNDGTQLRHFKALGYDVLGVEASRGTAEIANNAGIETLNCFFDGALARSLHRTFDVVNASGVFFHLEELHSVTDGVHQVLARDGVFVVQFLYMKRILENNAFDQIYHEHLLYYNLETIERLLTRHGLALFDAYVSPIHGGSVIAFAGHSGTRVASDRLAHLRHEEELAQANSIEAYRSFARRIEIMKETNLQYLDAARSSGRVVFGLGAPVKGNTLLNTFGVRADRIRCLVEKNPLRRGLFAPGSHIPVVLESELDETPDIYYVLAWNFKREILANYESHRQRGVEFYFPVDPKDA